MATVISGDTGVSAVQPGVVAQGDLAANVVGNGPAFIASCAGVQTFASGTAVKFQTVTELFDTHGYYDAPNSKFTPLVAGFYQVNCTVGSTAGTALTFISASVRKNGVSPAELLNGATASSTSAQRHVSGLIYLDGIDDYIEPFIVVTGTGTLTAVASENAFSAVLVRAA